MRHASRIRIQFSRQAVPFSQAPAMGDRGAIDLLVDAANLQPGGSVLDVACGPGLVALALAESGASVTAVDATPAMIGRARELAAERGRDQISFEAGDAGALRFEAHRFDAAVCRFAFHHFLEPDRALAEMRRVVRPGGRVVVCDGVASSVVAKAEAFNAMERLRDPSTVAFLTEQALTHLFAAANLAIDSVQRYRVPVELEGLMAVSFPDPGHAELVRRIIEDSAADDALGMGTRRENGRTLLHYPAVVVAAVVPT